MGSVQVQWKAGNSTSQCQRQQREHFNSDLNTKIYQHSKMTCSELLWSLPNGSSKNFPLFPKVIKKILFNCLNGIL